MFQSLTRLNFKPHLVRLSKNALSICWRQCRLAATLQVLPYETLPIFFFKTALCTFAVAFCVRDHSGSDCMACNQPSAASKQPHALDEWISLRL